MEQQLVWVGMRESDIEDTNGIFDGSITVFGPGSNGNVSMEEKLHLRIDHNKECPAYDSFMEDAMRQMLVDQPQVRFLQYAPLDSAAFPPELQNSFCCQNDYALLEFLEHKRKVKLWAKEYVPVLPYQEMPGRECIFEGLKRKFPECGAFVVQRDSSCGGIGTFLLRGGAGRLPDLSVGEEELCMVTAFQEKSISVNVHAVLYPEHTLIFPPSIQIIDQEHMRLEYLGADFSAYHNVPSEEQKLLLEASFGIGEGLRQLGYRGVCGIDLLLVDSTCYFMEINPRFQASTALLNRYLVRCGLPSVQEYHMDAFLHKSSQLPGPPDTAEGSFFIYHFHKEQENSLRWMREALQKAEGFSVCDDSLRWEYELEKGCYLFQLRYEKAISSLTYQHTLRLHPNVKLSPFVLEDTSGYSDLLYLKLILLCRGISIKQAVWERVQKAGGADWEEFSAITIGLFDKIWITAPCMEKWHDLSPVELDVMPGGLELGLRYYGNMLFPVEIMPEDPCGMIKTKNGHFLKDIVYLNPDRLRIYHRSGCALQEKGDGCGFCDLYGGDEKFGFEDICEALSYYWSNPRVEHFLIGGGSELYPEQCGSILRLAEYLHMHTDKHIYLMSQPICDMEVLNRLKMSGVTEVSFNIEMFDRDLALKTMPGKGRISLEHYFDSLKNAVSLWGNAGCVRSVLILGFDELAVFSQGVRALCRMGVAPILSLYRPCEGTPLADYMTIDESTALLYYKTADEICREFGMRIGPSCKACQNNTVALDI